jgi:nucleoid DNA-binding protein
VNATELAEKVALRTGMSRRAARQFLEAALDEISGELASGQKVVLSGFGTFDVRDRSARDRRHPATGELVKSPETRAVVFRSGSDLRSAVAGQLGADQSPRPT